MPTNLGFDQKLTFPLSARSSTQETNSKFNFKSPRSGITTD